MKLKERMGKYKRKLEQELEAVYQKRQQQPRESHFWHHYNSYAVALESCLTLFRYWFFPRKDRDPEEIVIVKIQEDATE